MQCRRLLNQYLCKKFPKFNDLFDNARSIRRILCPPRDAFERLEDIKQEACKVEKEALFLIALGPAATVLAYDLFKAGYQAIDVGHVDWNENMSTKLPLAAKWRMPEKNTGNKSSPKSFEEEKTV